MIPVRAFDVLCNLKNWTSWDYKAYKLQENEAHACKKALENYIWHDVEKEGMPKEEGWYLFKTSINTYIVEYCPSNINAEVVSWRKIVDDEEDK